MYVIRVYGTRDTVSYTNYSDYSTDHLTDLLKINEQLENYETCCLIRDEIDARTKMQ